MKTELKHFGVKGMRWGIRNEKGRSLDNPFGWGGKKVNLNQSKTFNARLKRAFLGNPEAVINGMGMGILRKRYNSLSPERQALMAKRVESNLKIINILAIPYSALQIYQLSKYA